MAVICCLACISQYEQLVSIYYMKMYRVWLAYDCTSRRQLRTNMICSLRAYKCKISNTTGFVYFLSRSLN